MKRRPIRVQQRESDAGEFWYVLKGVNGLVTSASEMFASRSNAIRAARNFIASIDPVPVIFTYWTGPLPPHGDWDAARPVTERVRC